MWLVIRPACIWQTLAAWRRSLDALAAAGMVETVETAATTRQPLRAREKIPLASPLTRATGPALRRPTTPFAAPASAPSRPSTSAASAASWASCLSPLSFDGWMGVSFGGKPHTVEGGMALSIFNMASKSSTEVGEPCFCFCPVPRPPPMPTPPPLASMSLPADSMVAAAGALALAIFFSAARSPSSRLLAGLLMCAVAVEATGLLGGIAMASMASSTSLRLSQANVVVRGRGATTCVEATPPSCACAWVASASARRRSMSISIAAALASAERRWLSSSLLPQSAIISTARAFSSLAFSSTGRHSSSLSKPPSSSSSMSTRPVVTSPMTASRMVRSLMTTSFLRRQR
mmetsp:Transcript_13373/g.30473  ORF Transcript_13373/g.30473 Transcript_13373/m.30473 type:complete len:347 (-) Transcript_13373:111-1151(-)